MAKKYDSALNQNCGYILTNNTVNCDNIVGVLFSDNIVIVKKDIKKIRNIFWQNLLLKLSLYCGQKIYDCITTI